MEPRDNWVIEPADPETQAPAGTIGPLVTSRRPRPRRTCTCKCDRCTSAAAHMSASTWPSCGCRACDPDKCTITNSDGVVLVRCLYPQHIARQYRRARMRVTRAREQILGMALLQHALIRVWIRVFGTDDCVGVNLLPSHTCDVVDYLVCMKLGYTLMTLTYVCVRGGAVRELAPGVSLFDCRVVTDGIIHAYR